MCRIVKEGGASNGRINSSLSGRIAREELAVCEMTEGTRMDGETRNEAMLRSILTASPVGTSLTTPDMVFLLVNESLASMVGYATEELKGESARLLHPSDEESHPGERDGLRCGAGRQNGTTETKWLHVDGTILDILAKAGSRKLRGHCRGGGPRRLSTSPNVSAGKRPSRTSRRRDTGIFSRECQRSHLRCPGRKGRVP